MKCVCQFPLPFLVLKFVVQSSYWGFIDLLLTLKINKVLMLLLFCCCCCSASSSFADNPGNCYCIALQICRLLHMITGICTLFGGGFCLRFYIITKQTGVFKTFMTGFFVVFHRLFTITKDTIAQRYEYLGCVLKQYI